MSNPKSESNEVLDEKKAPVSEGLPPWLKDKKKGKKGKDEEMEEAKKMKDEEEMEEAKKVVKEEECSCNEDDDLPWCDDCEEEDDMEEAKKPEPKKMKEHLAPLFDGQNLSEDFKTKAETIFGAVIAEREADMKSHYEAALAEAVATTQSDLAEKVDEYLSYVVEEWYKENKIALERSLRAEIAENFMEGLRNLFTDNFITIPEDKVDVLEAANTKIEELTTQVNEEIKNSMEKAKKIGELEARIAFSESIEGLTLSEVEKLKGLAESVEFDSVDEYKNKLSVLKETYLKTPVQAETLIEESKPAQASLSPVMEAYTRSLSKFRN
jgi:hypothetical protein